MQLNEADTKAKLIDPKLHGIGWVEDLVSREYAISIGRIEIIGETHRRSSPLRADYILRLNQHGEALAVVEAKEEGFPATRGMSQAKDYAKKLGLLFAYSTNGHEIEEFDFLTNKQKAVEDFPSPQELKQRYISAILKGVVDKEKSEKILNEPYYFAPSFSLEKFIHTLSQMSVEDVEVLRDVDTSRQDKNYQIYGNEDTRLANIYSLISLGILMNDPSSRLGPMNAPFVWISEFGKEFVTYIENEN